MIRPERIRLISGADPADGNTTTGTVQALQYFGAFWRMTVSRDGSSDLLVDLALDAVRPEPGARVQLHWDASAVHPLDATR